MPAAGRAKGCHDSCQRLPRLTPKAVTTDAEACYGGSEALQRGEGASGTDANSQRNTRQRRLEQPERATTGREKFKNLKIKVYESEIH